MSVEVISFDSQLVSPSDAVRLNFKNSYCCVYLFGATLYSWTPVGYDERLWVSRISAMDGKSPIRGGIPIAFPQFAFQGSLPLHGFVRQCLWTFVSSNCDESGTSAVFQLRDNEWTRSLWNHRFEILYTVVLTLSSIRMEMTIKNLNYMVDCENRNKCNTFEFTNCLHTYFRTADIRNCLIKGLQNRNYIDKVDNCIMKSENDEYLQINEETISNESYFIDRIYPLLNNELGKKTEIEVITLEDRNNLSNCPPHYYNIKISNDFTDVVIFNPWKEGKKGPIKGPDFDDDGYNYMVCIEPAIASTIKELLPGEIWSGYNEIEVVALNSIL